MKIKRWSAKEVLLLKREVSKNPNNLKKAFEKVSIKTGRTVGAISVKWYTDISKKGNVCFTIISKEGIAQPNCKVTKQDVVKVKEKTHKDFWSMIKRIFKKKK